MFWERLYGLCNEKGIKPNNVCMELGLSNATATHWKKGTIPNGEVLSRIADYFDCSVDYLLGRTTKKELSDADGSNEDLLKLIDVMNDLPTEKIAVLLDYVRFLNSQRD